jgi:HD-like signal output (HDOD) protein
MANSAYYRISREPVETIGRAIVTLGTVGLRALVADSVMQPVFQVPRGYFEDFSPTVWRQAQHAAAAAQSYARATRSSDSFSAHLLALLFHMSHIVIFRVTVATYLGAKGALPRAEVFARLIDERSAQLACAIAREWDLPDTLVAALEEQVEQRAIGQLTPLALALYVGRICGAAIIATEDGAIGEAAVLELLERKHLPTDVAKTVWDSTRAFSRTDD